MKRILTFVLVWASLYANAQVDESQNFVYLNSDSVIYADRVRLRPDFFNSLKLNVDGNRVAFERVKFFQSDDGLFANTTRLTTLRTRGIAERIVGGKINLFQERDIESFSHYRGYRYSPEKISTRMFYNKAYGNLKKVNYHNLKMDMADDPQSIDLLEGYRKSTRTANIMYATAGASILAGVVALLINSDDSRQPLDLDNIDASFERHKNDLSDMNTGFILMGVGAGFAAGGYFIKISSLRKLEQSIDYYNR